MRPLAENATVKKANFRPWPNDFPEAIGDRLTARTDLGTEVEVWRPYETVPVDGQYWCHGHSTQSFRLHGYSIFGGKDMEAVLRDEWTRINKKPLPGDIIVFRIDYEHEITHTMRIERVAHSLGNSTEIQVSSKDGFRPLNNDASLDEAMEKYNAWWQQPDPGRDSCCGCFNTTTKEYYRRNNRRVGVRT